LPRAVAVVEHLVVRRLKPGHEDRARRRTHDGAGVVLGEGDAGFLQPLVGGQGEPRWPLRGVALLVGEDEEDVQTALAPARGWAVFLLLGFRSRRRPEERRCQGSGGQAVELTPREVAVARSCAHFELLSRRTTVGR